MQETITIDGQGCKLTDADGTLTVDGRRPNQTCRLRLEFASDEAVAAMQEAGFEFDDCRPAAVPHWIKNCYRYVRPGEYMVAFVSNDDWDIVEVFAAADVDEANTYAEANYPDDEWYVLDHEGQNVNV
jgi:hypothetical protein